MTVSSSTTMAPKKHFSPYKRKLGSIAGVTVTESPPRRPPLLDFTALHAVVEAPRVVAIGTGKKGAVSPFEGIENKLRYLFSKYFPC